MCEPLPSPVLVIGEGLWQSVLVHLNACLPNEGVGLLATLDEPGLVRAVRFYPGRNLNESPSRFTMDPLEVLRACEDMEMEGTRLGGVVHSHPTTAPEPSQTDLRELAMPDVVNLIVQLRPRVLARAWRITPGGSVELPIRVEATVPGEGSGV
jgi:proteasome lid subunit RPN8/RPN11